MKTLKFFASLGVIPGYGHENNARPEAPETVAGKAWQAAAAAVMAACGVYVGAVIAPAKTVYATDWGCPIGGEETVLLTGECNPQYTKLLAYRAAVVDTLRQTALALGQDTTQLTFMEVDFEYLDFRPKTEK